MRRLGGLRVRMRVTFAAFATGMMALAGVPFLFSGFWSKEAILHAAREWDVSCLPLTMGLMAVVLTAFYMTRLVAEVFFGKARSPEAEHAHENSAVMTVPLVLLAVCAVVLGFLGTPAWPWLQSALTGAPVAPHSIFEGGGLMMLSIVLVALGLGGGWALYGRRLRRTETAPDPLARSAPALFAFLGDRMRFDELYAATAGRLNTFLAAFADWADRRVWGGLVNFLALLGEFAGTVNREADEDGLNGGFNVTSEKLRGAGLGYSRAQTGEAHGYLRVLAIGFVVLVLGMILGGAR
jgi:NADH-quinone oxidoreductase subunit L